MQLLRPSLRTLFTVAASLACGACGSSSTSTPGATPAAEPAPKPTADTSDALFDIDRLLRIELTVAPADWDKARKQHHDPEQVFGEDCLAGPATRPYDYVPATLSLDGAAPVAVEIRKKGFLGSVNAERPSLKVRFATAHQGVTRMTLNNNQQDPSQVHQCVAYRAFARAGVPAPRCNLAVVTLNGESLGVYSHVESIKKPFLRRVFGDDSGNLYEGNISDFRPDWINTMQRKTNREDADRSDLTAVVDALQRPDGEVISHVEQHVDLDAFVTFWAMERLVGQWDGYTNNQNNFYVYEVPGTGKLQFIPWGADSVLGDPDLLSRYDAPDSVYATSALPHRLYAHPSMKQRYATRLRELVDAWDADAMLAEVATLERLARPHLHISEASFDAGLAKVRGFIGARRKTIEAALADGPQEWKAALRSSPCSVTGGTIAATFEATWSKDQPINPLAAGSATIDADHRGAKMTFTSAGVTAGSSDQFGDKPTIGLFGMRDDGVIVIAFLIVDPDEFKPGAKVDLDAYTALGIVVEVKFGSNEPKLGGFLGRGTVELTTAGTGEGDAVAGKVTAEITHPKYWLDEASPPSPTLPPGQGGRRP